MRYLAFHLLMEPSGFLLILNSHFVSMTLRSFGRGTTFQVLFSCKELYSSCIANFHSLASLRLKASLTLTGSLSSLGVSSISMNSVEPVTMLLTILFISQSSNAFVSERLSRDSHVFSDSS